MVKDLGVVAITAAAQIAHPTTIIEPVRMLDLDDKSSPRYLAAASGLVRVADVYWVVADDENCVGMFPAKGYGKGTVLEVFPGKLPDVPKERKAKKPDLESLVLLPSRATGLPYDALLALGSGSKPTRNRGVVIPIDAAGKARGPAAALDLTLVYMVLRPRFGKLNIEGAALVGNRLRLAQRGNGKENVNALIDIELAEVAKAISSGQPVPATAVRDVRTIELGHIQDVPWSFTDFAPISGDRLVFTAAAEASADTYEDGIVVGAAIGIIDRQGRVTAFSQISPLVKLEGVSVMAERPDLLELALVSDADDTSRPATLYHAKLSLTRL